MLRQGQGKVRVICKRTFAAKRLASADVIRGVDFARKSELLLAVRGGLQAGGVEAPRAGEE